MLYICIFSNKFDLIQAIRVSHNKTGLKMPNIKKLFFRDSGTPSKLS